MTKPVGELMHPDLITCPRDTPLGQVAKLLMQHRVHALVVTEADGRAVGLISDFDLLAGEWLSTDRESLETMRRMTAGELMSVPLNTIDAGSPASEAAQRMRREGFHRLIVTQDGQPRGVLSISDLVAYLATQEPASRQTVADVMSHAILVCRKETPVREVARTMTEARYRSVLVLEADGRPQGVVSGWDLLSCLGGKGCTDQTAADVMHPALTIRPDASLREASNLMIENHYHRLVVVDPARPEAVPLGILSSYDIVNEMARPDSVWQG
ncbi:MAG TPA: CBS domain-containing protein [Anaerolineales bacterium]|nr:CBS domain-containing protein [Anaerolineales bacterium]